VGYKHLILVEGNDDQHVIGHLLNYYNIDCILARDAQHAKFSQDSQIVIKETGGVEKLLSNLEIFLDDGDVQNLAIVVDADIDISTRWQAICRILRKSGEVELPTLPAQNGTVVDLLQTGRDLTVGIWMMPDNQASGMLEDFMQQLVPEDDNLWEYALECVAGLGEARCRFPEVKKSKAEIHTWLAWQNEPGRPFGVAIAANYLYAEAHYAKLFTQWAREVFGL
jgi:hypothetical protein